VPVDGLAGRQEMEAAGKNSAAASRDVVSIVSGAQD